MAVLYWDQGTLWDSGVYWDSGTTPQGNIQPYLNLVTSEHANKPNFILTLSAFLQPFADEIITLSSMPGFYDVNSAVGSQLDAVGQWVGVTRYLPIPLVNVYFSLDTPFLGFDQGSWQGPNDPTSGLLTLPDANYRLLLLARIASNQWNGTTSSAYAAYAILLAGTGITILIFDNENMTMDLGIVGGLPDAITLNLFQAGYLSLRPAGVQITNYLVPSVTGAPFFGFDVSNLLIAGFDIGAWAIPISQLLPPIAYLVADDNSTLLVDDTGTLNLLAG